MILMSVKFRSYVFLLRHHADNFFTDFPVQEIPWRFYYSDYYEISRLYEIGWLIQYLQNQSIEPYSEAAQLSPQR